MAVDTKFIGKKYPPSTYEIGKEKIKEYALAVGDNNPLYLNDEKAAASKYGGIIAPPTFAVVFAKEPVGRMLLDPDLALNLMMLVHGEEEFEFINIARPGDVITTEGEIAEIYEKKGKSFISMATTSKNQKGEEVCKAKWMFVIRG
ncbi:MAG: MaoC family dehydratase N-terminal domain-containing protein [bacterium]